MIDPVELLTAAVAELPAVDQHCHTLVPDWPDLGDGAAPRWRRCFTEARRPASLTADVAASAGYREFLRGLATYVGASEIGPDGFEAAVVERRAIAVGGDPDEYARGLFDDARVSALLVDTGYGSKASTTSGLERTIGRPVRTIVRIESVAERCLAEAHPRTLTRAGFDEAFLESLAAEVDAGAAGFKSIAAYRAGLDLPEPSASTLAGAIRRLDREAQARRLFDPVIIAHIVWLTARYAAAAGLPLQFHVGFGDEDVHLPSADPTLLRPLLQAASAESCHIVLLHNHPFVDQAAYLASIYPQVHVDLSLTIPLLGGAAAARAISS